MPPKSLFNKIRQNFPLLAAGMNGVFCRGKLENTISRFGNERESLLAKSFHLLAKSRFASGKTAA
jgi:hypothetical protein